MTKISTPDLSDTAPDAAALELPWINYGQQRQFGGQAVTIKCHEDTSLLKQCVAEQLVTVRTKRGFARLEWQKMRERNEALETAEGYLEVARKDLGRRFTKEVGELRFLERGVALRSDRGEFEEALRLCDLALGLGLGEEYERKKASLIRMT